MKTPPWLANAEPSQPNSSRKKTKSKVSTKPKHTDPAHTTPKGYRSISRAKMMERANGADHGSSKYTDAYARALLDYFNVTSYTSDTGQDFCSKDGYYVEGGREGADLPTIAGFCASQGISRVTYHRWAHDVDVDGQPKYGLFPLAHDLAKSVQQDLLINNGLKSYYNAGFAKFLLNTTHDMVEKSSRDVNMKGSITISVDQDDDEL